MTGSEFVKVLDNFEDFCSIQQIKLFMTVGLNGGKATSDQLIVATKLSQSAVSKNVRFLAGWKSSDDPDDAHGLGLLKLQINEYNPMVRDILFSDKGRELYDSLFE